MRRLARRAARRGAATAEAAIVIPTFLTLVVGTIDLGMGVLRSNALSHAARDAARRAAVHGSLAPAGWEGGPWGPATVDQPATATGVPVVDYLRPRLPLASPSDTRVKVEWVNGDNRVGSPVRVTLTSSYRPMVAVIFGGEAVPLTASSTMPIAH